MNPEYPPLDELADADDQLGWDREKHGPMLATATGPEEEPETIPYEGDDD